MTREEIIKKIKNSEVSKIKFAVADIDGVLRGKYINKDKFLEAIEKEIGFCDVIFGWDSNDVGYENGKITGWHTGYPDAQVKIDINTFREIPWENSTPFFLADFSSIENKHSIACSRSLLKRVVAECKEMGFTAFFALEAEWFNFKGAPGELNLNDSRQLQPITPGMFGYSISRTSMNSEYVKELFDLLKRFNIIRS